jgi:uncharacterized membrane protein YphA (DoxX/SURF4 family)
MDLLLQPTLTVFLRTFLALLFVVAAISKLQHREEFYGVVRNFRLTPDWLSRPLATLLPVAELAVAAGLLIRPLAPWAAAFAAALLLVFAVAIAVNVLRGRVAIDCGCFRQGMKQPLSWLLVLRNVALAAAALLVAAVLPAVPPAAIPDLVTGTTAGGLAMILYFSVSLLSGLPAPRRTARTS